MDDFGGAALGISINGLTASKESDFILNFKASSVKNLEIYGFTSRTSGNPQVHRHP